MIKFNKFLPALAIALPLLAVAAFSSANGGFLAAVANAGYGGQYAPTISPMSQTVTPGQHLDFNGRGFASEETVTITMDGTVVGSAHADGGGNFSTGSLSAPTTSGPHTYTFTGSTSNTPVSSVITVSGSSTGGNGSGTTPTYSPTITPAAATVTPGQHLDFNGRGFAPEETVVIMMNGTTVGSAHADGGGNFSTGSLSAPTTPGQYNYTFTGNTSNVVVPSSITVQ